MQADNFIEYLVNIIRSKHTSSQTFQEKFFIKFSLPTVEPLFTIQMLLDRRGGLIAEKLSFKFQNTELNLLPVKSLRVALLFVNW